MKLEHKIRAKLLLYRLRFVVEVALVWTAYVLLMELCRPLPYPSIQWSTTRLIFFLAYLPLMYYSAKTLKKALH